MSRLGTQLLLEFYDCDPIVINDKQQVLRILLRDALGSTAQIEPDQFYTFSPHGLSGAIGLDGSLVAIHTWPENGQATVDIYSCREDLDAHGIQEALALRFSAGRVSSLSFDRGMPVEQGQRDRVPVGVA